MLETELLHHRTTTKVSLAAGTSLPGMRGIPPLLSLQFSLTEVYSQFVFSLPLSLLVVHEPWGQAKGCALQAQRRDPSWTHPPASSIASGFSLTAGLAVQRSQVAPWDKERHMDARQQGSSSNIRPN